MTTVSYTVNYRLHAGPGVWQTWTTTTNLNTVVGGGAGPQLNSGTAYDFQITADNGTGQAASAIVTATTTGLVTVQVSLGVHCALGLTSEPTGAYADGISHYNGFNTNMGLTAAGRKATIVATTLGSNSVLDYAPGAAPNTWGNGNVGTWTGQGYPVDGTVHPMLHWNFSDGATDTAYSIYSPANISTANYAATGHTVAYYITNQLTAWKNIGIKKIYNRINWEWNINGPEGGKYVPPASVAAWLDAWRGWSNVAHDWGNANGVAVYMVWAPAVFNNIDDGGVASGTPQAIRSYFPAPDGSAHAGSDGVTARYIDIIGADFYGQADPAYVPPGYSKLTNTVWCLRAMTDLCQDYSLNFGDSEFNDQLTTTQNAWQDWTPNHFVPWLNGLKSLSPPVKIEYICFFDLNIGNAHEFSSPADNQPGNLAIFGQGFGNLGPSVTYGTCAQVTTLA